MDTVAPQNSDSALESKIVITKKNNSTLINYGVSFRSNPLNFKTSDEVVELIDQQWNYKKYIEHKKEIKKKQDAPNTLMEKLKSMIWNTKGTRRVRNDLYTELLEDIDNLAINRSMTLYGNVHGTDVVVTHFKNPQGDSQYSIEPASSSVEPIPLRIIVPSGSYSSHQSMIVYKCVRTFMDSIALDPSNVYTNDTSESILPREPNNWEGTYTEKKGQGAVKFTVQTPEDLKKILDLCAKMDSIYYRSLLHTLLISYKGDTEMDTVAPQNSDSALEFKIVITKENNSKLINYDVYCSSNPLKANNFKTSDEVAEFIDQQWNNYKKYIIKKQKEEQKFNKEQIIKHLQKDFNEEVAAHESAKKKVKF